MRAPRRRQEPPGGLRTTRKPQDHQETPGGHRSSRKLQKLPEATGRPQEAPGPPGRPRRFQEAQGSPRSSQEAPGPPRRPQEVPGSPRTTRRLQESHQEAPGATRRPQDHQELLILPSLLSSPGKSMELRILLGVRTQRRSGQRKKPWRSDFRARPSAGAACSPTGTAMPLNHWNNVLTHTCNGSLGGWGCGPRQWVYQCTCVFLLTCPS